MMNQLIGISRLGIINAIKVLQSKAIKVLQGEATKFSSARQQSPPVRGNKALRCEAMSSSATHKCMNQRPSVEGNKSFDYERQRSDFYSRTRTTSNWKHVSESNIECEQTCTKGQKPHRNDDNDRLDSNSSVIDIIQSVSRALNTVLLRKTTFSHRPSASPSRHRHTQPVRHNLHDTEHARNESFS